MYSTCLFCSAHLGENEIVESFPVGRRLAFDPQRGRLWVVCRACERWNLSALEERWEAIEECERHYRETRLRVSTENIGLARLSEGLELVRIGQPHRPEMAAWRYGDQFGRRRRRRLLQVGLGLGAFGTVVAGGAWAGVSIGAFGYWVAQAAERIIQGDPKAVVARIPGSDTLYDEVRRKDLARVRLVSSGGAEPWRLQMRLKGEEREYSGERAVRVAGLLLPTVNRFGGTKVQVARAVDYLEDAGEVGAVFAQAGRLHEGPDPSPVTKLPYPVRLALEMAAHEESERRALEGELAALEQAWREAEEIAGISDGLLLPSSIDDWIRRLRGA